MRKLFFLLIALISSLQIESKCILVTGGAGFIGSHVNEMLYQNGYQTIVLDNLSSGNRNAVLHGTLIEGDLNNPELLDHIFSTYPIDAVLHFAAFIEVGESVTDSLKYYKNNVGSTITLLDAMHRHHVNKIVFSSSAAIYGIPSEACVVEETLHQPINPYGQTKLMVELILRDMDHSYGLRYGCLRYFNVAGGDPKGILKNYQKKALNFIPIVLRSLQSEKGAVTIFGTDYPTPDGTCIRDYIHVEDLASAHIASLEKLLGGGSSHAYNLGNGRGYSVKEVIAAVEKVTGLPVRAVEGERRAGDTAMVIANPSKAFQELGWKPVYTSIDSMIDHAWVSMQN